MMGTSYSRWRLLRKLHKSLSLLSTLHHYPWSIMSLMGARCAELDRGLKTSTTFRNIYCVGRWIQWNILCIDHTTSFNRLVLQNIHNLMTRQHRLCEYNHFTTGDSQFPTHKGCKTFLTDISDPSGQNLSAGPGIFWLWQSICSPERTTSAYNRCFYSIWTSAVQTEDVPAETSEEQMEEDEPVFWEQPPLVTTAFMFSIWKVMKIFRGQIRHATDGGTEH